MRCSLLSQTHTGPGDQRQVQVLPRHPAHALSPRTPSLQGLTRPCPSAAAQHESPSPRDPGSSPFPATSRHATWKAAKLSLPGLRLYNGHAAGPPRNANRWKSNTNTQRKQLTSDWKRPPETSTPSPWKQAVRSKAGEEMIPQAQQRHFLSLTNGAHLITKDSKWGECRRAASTWRRLLGSQRTNLRQRSHRTLPQRRGGGAGEVTHLAPRRRLQTICPASSDY